MDAAGRTGGVQVLPELHGDAEDQQVVDDVEDHSVVAGLGLERGYYLN